MSQYNLADSDFESWDSEQLATYLRGRKHMNNADYTEIFLENKIDAKTAFRLSEDDLAELGISKIGDRLKIIDALESLKLAKQQVDFETILWEGTEELYWSCYDKNCATGCGVCNVCATQEPSQYKLSRNNLEIKSEDRRCCGCCCGSGIYEIDNIDLSNVTDVDMNRVRPPCCLGWFCCAKEQEHISIQTVNEGTKLIRLDDGVGTDVSKKIKNQVELMQRIERK